MLGLIMVAVLAQASLSQAGASGDPEDSPLYAVSRKNALADMLARDYTRTGQSGLPGVPLSAGGIVALEGTKWHILPASPSPRGPAPTGVTTEATCIGAPTCHGTITCNSPTCVLWPTCDASVTCYSHLTCGGQPTCAPQPTCTPSPSCFDLTCSATCSGNSTCSDTCSVGHCSPPLITAVNVPAPGQFQLSFSAQGQQVSYHVFYGTTLDATQSQWTDVFSVPGTNGVITFTHTNNAPRAYYRVSIRNL